MKTRSTLVAAALVAASLPALQGCFPVVATGVGAGALATADRRSYGTLVTDQEIERESERRIEEKFGTNTHIDVTSYNRRVLVAGEAPDAAAKAEVERLVAGVSNVRDVTNEIQVGPPSSLSQRSNDAFITSKVKGNFVDANKFYPNHVKVVTEAGTVFLMGLVTRKEGDDAAQIASTTRGVQKVVRVFEYIVDDQARQTDPRPAESTTPAAK